MSKHPLNLAFRFFLEIAALFVFGLWGWQARMDALRYFLAAGLPLAAAALWGIFRVPGDPDSAPVAIPGILRLLIELLFFSAAVLALIDTGTPVMGWIYAGLVVLHYAISYDRIIWLLWQ